MHPNDRIRRTSLSLAACCLLLGLGSAAPGAPPKEGTSDPQGAAPEQVPELRAAPDHAMRYYLALPEGWTEQQTWPIAVNIAARSRAFEKNNRDFARVRRDRPFILVTPVSFSNTDRITADSYSAFYPEGLIEEMRTASFERRLDFDVAGLRRVLADVRKRYSGAEKAYIAGWSGGGHLAWAMVVSHPDELAAAATAGGNFFRKLAASQGISTSSTRYCSPSGRWRGPSPMSTAFRTCACAG
jgi:dienelactone hydrolase